MTCDVFLLAGQSNATGNGDPFDETLDAVVVPGVRQWDAGAQQVVDAVSPLKHHTAPQRVGFGYHFGVMYKYTTGRDVLLVPRGMDGSRMRDGFWQPGSPGGEGFEDAIRECNAALAATGGRFTGILWHQGEADTVLKPAEEQHRALLRELITGLRTRIEGAQDAIFLCGGMVPEWVAVTPEAAPVAAALAGVARNNRRARYVSADGLTGNEWPDDKIHMSAASQRTFALRYLSAYLELEASAGEPEVEVEVEPEIVPEILETVPAEAPAAEPELAAPSVRSRYKFSLVACARWEENDIVEWIEYHRAIGIEHFYIYSNDDTPTTLFKVLSPYIFQNDPIVTYRHWPFPGQQPQIYFHFLDNFLHETEWFSFLDIDEFLVFKNVDSISTFMKKFEAAYDAVYLNWLIYGNNSLLERDEDSILLTYTRRADHIDHHTKVITRSSAVNPAAVRQKFAAGAIGFWHFWNNYGLDINRLTNAIGGNVEGYTDAFPEQAMAHVRRPGVSEAMINTAYVAHFQFKSEQDFIRRAERGGFPIASTWEKIYADGSYRKLLDRLNAVEDHYLASFWARRVGRCYETAAFNPVPRPNLPNIALRKPSRQSSRLSGKMAEKNHLLGHGNDGFRSGSSGFHTDIEDMPWWEVDFLGQYAIRQVHIYNRVDGPGLAERGGHIAVETSATGEDWTEIFVHGDGPVFQGIVGGPLVIRLESEMVARYLRVVSRTRTFLHLDEVEVYGTQVA